MTHLWFKIGCLEKLSQDRRVSCLSWCWPTKFGIFGECKRMWSHLHAQCTPHTPHRMCYRIKDYRTPETLGHHVVTAMLASFCFYPFAHYYALFFIGSLALLWQQIIVAVRSSIRFSRRHSGAYQHSANDIRWPQVPSSQGAIPKRVQLFQCVLPNATTRGFIAINIYIF